MTPTYCKCRQPDAGQKYKINKRYTLYNNSV